MKQIDYSSSARFLLTRQKEDWDMCRDGYKSLDTVKIKEFHIDGFHLKVQFNPGRIISTSAKVDPKSIAERKCFLCYENLPQKQEKLEYRNGFLILVNPFPIFPEHFTIPQIEHTPQRIQGNVNVMTAMAKDLGKYYTIFYNGPKCGASAPDHMHFQAGTKGFMPYDYEYTMIKKNFGVSVYMTGDVAVYGLNDGFRRIISIESKKAESLEKAFGHFYGIYEEFHPGQEEPMMNVIMNFDFVENKYTLSVFLRAKHRPVRYFAEDDTKIMLSPASVDVGGVNIIPVEDHFNKINREILEEIYSEVFISESDFKKLIIRLKETA